jgi:hypothetical protein
LTTSDPLMRAHALVRSVSPRFDDDRVIAHEIAAISRVISSSELENAVAELVK